MKVQTHHRPTDTITDTTLGALPRKARCWCFQPAPWGPWLDGQPVTRAQLGELLRRGGVALVESEVGCVLVSKAD